MEAEMNGRKDRILVPSAVALIAFGATLLLASDITRCPCLWLYCKSGTMFDFPELLVSTGILTVGIGYLCHALFTCWTLKCRESRLVDFPELISVFGLTKKKLSNEELQKLNEDELQKLEDELLAEFHLRLHSHAPSTLIDFCSRRNTGWYVAKTSAIASIIGYYVALLLMCYISAEPFRHPVVLVILGAIFVLFIPSTLCLQGTKWNQEFWAVCWKWICWDIQSHPFPPEWPKRMKDKELETIFNKLKKNDSTD